MRNKKILKLLFVLIGIGSIILFIRWNSEFNKNNRYLNSKLLNNTSKLSGTSEELFDIVYDKLYVFEPYQSKEDMEKEIGFKSSVLIETVSEGMMNILFVKKDSPVAYFYGYPSNKGYNIDLTEGNYTKLEIDSLSYNIKISEPRDSSGDEKTYKNYIFTK